MNKQEMDQSANRDLTCAVSLRRFVVIAAGAAVCLLGLSWFCLDETASTQVSEWIRAERLDNGTYSAVVILVLASDLLLPIPSSLLLTHCGMKLGLLNGCLVGFAGITLGSVIGFAVARWAGVTILKRRILPEDQQALRDGIERFGVYAVVFLRPVPILAEASVLILAVGQMSWSSFLGWLTLSNFFVALFFVTFGSWAEENQIGDLTALLISMAIPILMLCLFRFGFRTMKFQEK